MAYDFNGSTDFFRLSTAPVTAVPLTMACFFNVDTARQQRFLSLPRASDTSSTGFALEMVVVGGLSNQIRAQTAQLGTFAFAETTAGFDLGTTHHACGVWSANNARAIYLNGGNKATNADSVTPGTPTETNIGGFFRNGALIVPTDGRIAEPAIWNAALTDEEVAALAKGISPALIRPQSLVFYPPLIRDLVNLRGGALTVGGGSPTVAAHPRVYGL